MQKRDDVFCLARRQSGIMNDAVVSDREADLLDKNIFVRYAKAIVVVLAIRN